MEEFFKILIEQKHIINVTIIYLDINPNGLYRDSIKDIALNYFKSRRIFERYFKHLKNWEIYFSGYSYTLILFMYIKKLSKNNLVFHFGGGRRDEKEEKNGCKSVLLKFFIRLLFGLKIRIIKYGKSIFFELTDDFFKNNNVQYKKIKRPLTLPKIKINGINDKEILILMNDLPKFGWVTEDAFAKAMNQLLDILQCSGKKYVIKCHPNEPKLYGKMTKDKNIIPSVIPVEFILDHPWKMVIGTLTTGLISASKKQHIKSVSILYCIDSFDEDVRKRFYNWLKNESDNKILFISNFKELKLIVDQLSQ